MSGRRERQRTDAPASGEVARAHGRPYATADVGPVGAVDPGVADTGLRPVTDPSMDDPLEAVDHLVCCRRTWSTAMCGADVSDDYVTLIFDRPCPLCIEAARDALAARGQAFPGSPPTCPADGTKCPEAAELDALLERHVRDS